MSKKQFLSVFNKFSLGNFSIKKPVLFKSRNSPTISINRKKHVKARFQQVSLFVLVGIMAFTVSSPVYALDLFNTLNPPEIKRSKVAALDSPFNSTKAQPHQSSNDFLLSNRYNNQEKSDSKPVKELVDMRTAYTKTYLNSDGTKTLDYVTTQRHYKDTGDKNAKWQDIDNTLNQKLTKDKSRYFVGDAGNMSSSMNRLSKGVSVEIESKDITVKPLAASNVEPEQVDERTVVYKNAWPGVDLEYELRGEAVKEMIIIKDKNAPTTYNFSVTGGKVINHPTRDGELTIAGLPDDYSFSALTLAVNDRGVISEKRVSQSPSKDGSGIIVQLDKDWLRGQSDSAFPMRIDPTMQKQSEISYKMYKSDGYKCSSSNCYANTGSIKDGSWKHWRSYIKFPYSELNNKTVLDAKLYGWYKSGADGTNDPSKIYLGHASCYDDYDCVGSSAGSQDDVTTNFNISFTSKLKSLVDADNYSAWWSVRGKQGSSKTFKPYYDMRATVKYDTPTPMTKASLPADKSTVVTTQPTLKVNSITDADGDAMKYYFRVATNPDAQTGAVINSGWISSNEWKVPEFILQDGQTYYWKAYSKGYAETAPTWVRSFKVDMRTGKNSTQAYEDIGPVSVDLATGNATTSTGSHSISALGGDVGLTLNYNTPALVESGEAKKTSTKYGLTGYYYNDTSSSKAFPSNVMDPSRLLMVRNDNTIKFDWGTGAPSPGLPSDKFLVRWKGYVSVPESGSYSIGANSDDGVRIKLGTGMFGADETVLNSWSYIAGDRWGVAKNISAGQQIPITVEYYEDGGPAKMKLLVKGTDTPEQEMPTTWLAPNANVLPDGWELSMGDDDIEYERLHISSNSAVLSDSTGQKYEYKWENDSYIPPKDQEASLIHNEDSTYSVLDTDGTTYVFDVEGKLMSVASPEDDRQPGALKYTYAGNPSRLIKISDGVNQQRNGTLHYSGDNECEVMSGFDSIPAGYLCAFRTTDDRKTLFQYKDGNLARVIQPGDEYEDYGYDSFGRVVNYRDPIANDAISYGVRDNDTAVTTEIQYDSSGRVVSIKAPAPHSQMNRGIITVNYLSGSTEIHTVGASEPNGFSRKISYDNLFRTTSETTMDNLISLTEWHPERDLVLSTTDPMGLKSTAIYDKDDLLTDTYGPAPSSWFGLDRKPISGKENNVTHVKTSYDEGLTGLGVAYYDNKKLLHTPKLNSTIIWDVDEEVKESFADEDLPITATDGWGARYTGNIKLGPTGNHTFKLRGDAGFRLFINDKLVIDGWGDGTLSGGDRTLTSSVLNNTEANSIHRIRIDQYHGVAGATNLQLYMSGPGQPESSVLSSLLSPGYGLETSVKSFDDELGDIESRSTYSNPAYGLLDKTILDPNGSAYQYDSQYETPGDGFLRPTSNTLPGGGTASYEYYGAIETRDNPCTTEIEMFYQSGRQKLERETDPDDSGPLSGRSTETIYNEEGAVIATRYNNDPWTCTSYDDRGRVVASDIPARDGMSGRIGTNNYLVDGNPLIVSTHDSSGTVIVENDILGQTIKYTDARGNITENTYDQFGKLTGRTSPLGTESFEYDQYDRMTAQKLDGITYSFITYDTYGRVQSIDYPAGLKLSGIGYDEYQQENSTTYTLADNSELTETIERAVTGDILSGVENGITKTYQYNSVGNLTKATIGDDVFEYGYENSENTCNQVQNSNYNAFKNGSRTWSKINGDRTDFCYDIADRLLSSTDATLTSPAYDSHGNTVSLGDSTHETNFGYDVSDRSTSISSGDSETLYTRDVTDRIIRREHKTNGSTVNDVYYGFTGGEDAPDFTTDTNGTVIQRYLTVAGDVIVTLDSTEQGAGAITYSLPNIHGDIFATVDGDGFLANTHVTGPFGEKIVGQLTLENTTDGTSLGYLGQYSRFTDVESSAISGGIIQMGARVYIPALGRFLQVDPVAGGTENSYVYPTDPINDQDTSGEWAFLIPLAIAAVRIVAPIVVRAVVKVIAKKVAKNVAKKVTKKSIKQVIKSAPRVAHRASPKIVKVAKKPKKTAVKRTVAKKSTAKKTVSKASTSKKVVSKSRNLTEQVAEKAIRSDPGIGKHLTNMPIRDPRYTGGDWVKVAYNYNGYRNNVRIHYFYNRVTHGINQLKFKDF